MRFELTTFSLARRRSTTELHPHFKLCHLLSRADARTQTRTGDTCIFSAVLYQLSYPGKDLATVFVKDVWILSKCSLNVKFCGRSSRDF